MLLPSGERSLPLSLPDQKSEEDWWCAEVIRQELTGEGMELSVAYAVKNSKQWCPKCYKLKIKGNND
jgi:phosphosulfolactate phosphohydrolase-like enzyme